jgi:hypothetical protein
MVGSWEIETASEPEKWFALARAYLDASVHLCEGMISGAFPLTYSNGQVILGLAHHSVELFYKGVIHDVTGQMPNSTHNLHALENELKTVAPAIASAFISPFSLENIPAGLDEEALKKATGNERDQRFRYHHDRNGNSWSGVQGFMPQNFLAELRYCSAQYDAYIH